MSKISQELNAVMAKRVVTDEQYLALLKRENGNLGNMVRQLQEEKQNLSDALNQSTLINDGLVQQVRSARGHLNLYALFSCEGSDSYDPECAALNIDKARGCTEMSQLLSDEEITLIVRECAKGSAINRDGSTSHRIARAVIAAYEAKLREQKPVAFYDGNKFYANEESAICGCADIANLNPVFTHPAPIPEGLLDLLAIIHRDGGHYTDEHGIDKAINDAKDKVWAMQAEASSEC